MERSPKRQRLLDPIDFSTPTTYNDYEDEDDDGFYDTVDNSRLEPDAESVYPEDGIEGAAGEVLGQYEEDEDDEDDQNDEEFERSRAALDSKLKSTFEAIFEKYGRDFTGVGDEIDVRTGEIVVDNGHLSGMRNETDAGRRGSAQILSKVLSGEPEDEFDEEEDEEEDDEAQVGDEEGDEFDTEDGDEDDMLLYNRPTSGSIPPQRPPNSFFNVPAPQERRAKSETPEESNNKYLPDAEIMSQFGPKLGEHILKYISQDQVPHNASEPVWQTEGPAITPGKRPLLRSLLLEPEKEPSPTPNIALSMWGPNVRRLPGRPRKDGSDIMALMKGKAINSRKYYTRKVVTTTRRTEYTIEPTFEQSMKVPLNDTQGSENDPDMDEEAMAKPVRKKKGTKHKFTDEDDEMLLDWVRRIRTRGDIPLFSQGGHWHDLEALNPRHTALSYLNRYRQYYYLVGKHHLTAPEGSEPIEYPGPRKKKRKQDADAPDEGIESRSASPGDLDIQSHFFAPGPSTTTHEDSSSKMDALVRDVLYRFAPNAPSVYISPYPQRGPVDNGISQTQVAQEPGVTFVDDNHDQPTGIPTSTDPTSHDLDTDVDGSSRSLLAVTQAITDPVSNEQEIRADHISLEPGTEISSISDSTDQVLETKVGDSQSIVIPSSSDPTSNGLSSPAASSSITGSKTKEALQKQVQSFQRNTVPTSYDFSDEEEEELPLRPEAILAVAKAKSTGLHDRLEVKKPGESQDQTPPVLPEESQNTAPSTQESSSEQASKMYATTPLNQHKNKPTSQNSTKTKSSRYSRFEIMDSDDTDELSLTPSTADHPATLPLIHSIGKTNLTHSEPRSKHALDRVRRDAAAGSSTPSNRKRARPNFEIGYSSPSAAMNRTPGGTERRCGEAGFRCERDFCFMCQ